MRRAVAVGEALVANWDARYYRFRDAYSGLAPELRRRTLDLGPSKGWDAVLKTYAVGEDVATRQASEAAIQALAGPMPERVGGSAGRRPGAGARTDPGEGGGGAGYGRAGGGEGVESRRRWARRGRRTEPRTAGR